MKLFMYYIALLSIIVTHLRTKQVHHVSHGSSLSYAQIGDKVSSQVGEAWVSQLDSFIDTVSRKIVDKLENSIADDNVSNKVAILLQNDAEIFDVNQYKGHDIAFVEELFINQLKEKFNNSKLGKKLKKLGSKTKKKVKDLYKKHKEKVYHFFKTMLKGLVLPISIKFIKKNIQSWKQNILDYTKKFNKESQEISVPIIESLYTNFEDKINDYSNKYSVNFEDEMKSFDTLISDKKEIDKIEKEEEESVLDL